MSKANLFSVRRVSLSIFLTVVLLNSATASSAPFCSQIMVPSTVGVAIDSWEQYEARNSDNLITVIKKLITNKQYQQAIARNDFHIQFLENIGVNFKNPENSSFSIKKFGDYYEERIQQYLLSGKIKPDEVLYPARVFKDSEGHFVFIKLWHPPSHDLLIAQEDFITNDLQLLMQKEGFFIVGDGGREMKTSSEEIWRFFDHDLGHISGLLDNPEYMAATRKLAQKQSLSRQDIETNYLALEPKLQSHGRISFQERYFYVTEFISYIPEKFKTLLHQTLALPQGFTLDSETPTYSQVENEIERRMQTDPGFLAGYLKSLIELNDQVAEAVGGGSRDIYNPIRWAQTTSKAFSPKCVISNNFSLQWLVEAARYLNANNAGFSPTMMNLAVTITQLMILSNRYTPQQWVNAAAKTGRDLCLDPLAREIRNSDALGLKRSLDWLF